MLKLLDILQEGTLQLTPEERDQVESMLPYVIDTIKEKNLSNKEFVEIGDINFKSSDGGEGTVKIYVGNDAPGYAAYHQSKDRKNLKDNYIVIQQSPFKPFLGILGKTYTTLTGDENATIEMIRAALKHELIHAKDPAENQHYMKEPYVVSDDNVYYKSWKEFQTMTGQFFESIITGTDRVVKSFSSREDSKEKIIKTKKALSDILNFYAGKNPFLSQDAIDFIQNTGKRNSFQSLIKYAEELMGAVTGITAPNALSVYVNFIKKIQEHNPEGYKEFLKDLYKTVDQAKDKLNNLKEMKNPYHLTSIYKELIKEIDTVAIPQTVILLENNFIKNIQSNDYFTIEERKAIALYLEYYNNFTEENINEFSSGLLNEGLKDWIGNAWSKIKNVYGNIKDFVVKVWTSIKNFVIEQSKKVYNWVKGKLSTAIPKIKEGIKVIKDKAQLALETNHIFKVYDWLSPNVVKIFNNLGEKAEEKAITEIKEIIFNSTFTRLLVENTEEIPTDVTKPGFVEKLKKIGVAIGPFLETLALIFNPLKYALVQIFKELTPQFLNAASQFISKVGGPAAIKYVVIPGILVELAELKGIFSGADDLLKASLALIPGIGSFLDIIMEVGHGVFIILAIYEILHEVLHGLKPELSKA